MGVVNGLGALVLVDVIDNIVANTQWVEIGTGTTAADPSDTTLVSAVVRNARQTYTQTPSSVTISGYFSSTQGNGNDITEYGVINGVYNTSSFGTLISRDVATAITKTSSIEIWVDETYNVTITLNT